MCSVPVINSPSVIIKKNALENNFIIWPNPTKEFLNIQCNTEIQSITVYNIIGQIVLNKKVNSKNFVLKTHDLLPGNYLLKITSDNNTFTKKIILVD